MAVTSAHTKFAPAPLPQFGEMLPVGTVRSRTSRISRVVTLTAVTIPPLGVAAAMGLLWHVAFHWSDLWIMIGMYVVCGFGITIGFHRLLTHRGFETSTPIKVTLAILGCMTMQGPLSQWVTDHRKHHAFSDYEDRVLRWVDRLYLVWFGLTLGIPFLIGYWIGGVDRGVEALLWGGFVRMFLYQHATFSANSICHIWGRQDYVSRDEARNNWIVALLVFGEGWHNNHHAFPTSARHGLHRYQLDVSWWIIRGLEKIGLVWDVRVPDDAQKARRRLRADAR